MLNYVIIKYNCLKLKNCVLNIKQKTNEMFQFLMLHMKW